MITKLERFLSKLKMRQLILLLCAQACAFTLLLGLYSNFVGNSMLEKTEYIYSYQGFTYVIGQVESGFLQVKSNYLAASVSYDEKFADAITTYNQQVRDQIDLYNSTPYEEEYEENLVQNIETAYIEYHDIITESLPLLADHKAVSADTTARLDKLESTLDSHITELQNYLISFADDDMASIRTFFDKNITYNAILFVLCATIFGSLGFFTILIFNHQSADINDALQCASTGDLTPVLTITEHDTEFNLMKSYLQQTLHSFSKTINELQAESTTVDTQSNDLREHADELTSSISDISESIQMVRSATEEQAIDIDSTVHVLNNFSNNLAAFGQSIDVLSSNSFEIAQIANTSTKHMDQVSLGIEDVNTLIGSFLGKFELLSAAITEISSITSFINSLSAQTNLLALNASIESARVGEAGKGFAVVASEIGKLADQSKEASNSISKLILQISSETDEMKKDGVVVKDKLSVSTATVEESLSSFKPMFALLDDIVAKIQNLTAASTTITAQKDQIYEKMEQTSFIANEISASADNIAKPLADISQISLALSDTSNHLHSLTNALNSNIQQFKTTKDN